MLNVFRLAGDASHLFSIVLLYSLFIDHDGISLKTQELYVIVFLTRYLDLFTKYYSLYNTIMKLVFLGTSVAIVWYMRYHKVVKQTYNKEEDTFKHYYLVVPSFVLALLIHRSFNTGEILWAFSLYLEAVAILPQLVLLQRSRNIDNLTGNYIFFLGAYRGLYILNWIYRFHGFQVSCRRLSMAIFSITTLRAGRIGKHSNFLRNVFSFGIVFNRSYKV